MKNAQQLFNEQLNITIPSELLIHRCISIKTYTQQENNNNETVFYNSSLNRFFQIKNGEKFMIDVDYNLPLMLEALKIAEKQEYINCMCEQQKIPHNTIIDNFFTKQMQQLNDKMEENRRRAYETAICVD